LSDIVKDAEDGYEAAQSYWSSIYQAAKDDLYFLSDEEGAQWDSKSFASRRKRNRPALQIDQLSQFVNQVSNDIRMNTPSVNVIPHSGGADIDTAEVFQGLICDIQQSSNADDSYDYAVNSAIKCSIGFIRVDHRYKDDNSFQQELYIERVVNPLAVLLDPASIAPDGSDAMCAYVLEEMSVDDFKKKYPGKEPVSFGGEDARSDIDEDMVVVCEYFKIEEETITLAEGPDGKGIEYDESMGDVPTRESTKRTVMRYHLSGQDVLKEQVFPGKYIPVIPVYGEEAWIDGKRNLYSLIRKAKDSQRRYNFWASTEAELLMKAPKATIIAVGGTTENYADDYKDPDNAIVLRYDQTDAKGNQAPPPQLNSGPQIPAGIVNAMQRASEDIKSTLGLYNAFLGQQSNETSGVAIQARKTEGDRAVYHFGDNLVRSITHLGRVLVNAIPAIHNKPEIIRIVGKEEDADEVGINGAMVKDQERPFFLSEGVYNVTVTTGASFATMREEAATFFQQVIQSQPQLIEVAGDLMFKYMDFPGAQALSERMKKILPPALQDEAEDPQVMALQQENEQLKQAMAGMQVEAQGVQMQLENKQGELQIKAQDTVIKAESDQSKNQIEILKLQLEQQKQDREYEIKVAELQLKSKELELKEQEMVLSAQQAAVQASLSAMPQSSGAYQEGQY